MFLRSTFILATLVATLSAPAAAWAYTDTGNYVDAGARNGFADPETALESQWNAGENAGPSTGQWFASGGDARLSGHSFATPGDLQGTGAQGWGGFSAAPGQPPQH